MFRLDLGRHTLTCLPWISQAGPWHSHRSPRPCQQFYERVMGLQQQKDNVDREYRQRHRQTHIDGQTEGTDGQTGQNTYRKDKIQAAH